MNDASTGSRAISVPERKKPRATLSRITCMPTHFASQSVSARICSTIAFRSGSIG
jgi:hypothetical protein